MVSLTSEVKIEFPESDHSSDGDRKESQWVKRKVQAS